MNDLQELLDRAAGPAQVDDATIDADLARGRRALRRHRATQAAGATVAAACVGLVAVGAMEVVGDGPAGDPPTATESEQGDGSSDAGDATRDAGGATRPDATDPGASDAPDGDAGGAGDAPGATDTPAPGADDPGTAPGDTDGPAATDTPTPDDDLGRGGPGGAPIDDDAVVLVDFEDEEPSGYEVGLIPEGWEIQGATPEAMTIAPVDAENQQPGSYVGKLLVMLRSASDDGRPHGDPIEVGERTGYLHNDGEVDMLTYQDDDGTWLYVQVPPKLGWGEDEIVEFAESVSVTPHAEEVHG